MKHVTTCRLCPVGRPFQITASPFDDIPIVGQEPGIKLGMFLKSLDNHLSQSAEQESRRIQKIIKERGINPTDPVAVSAIVQEIGCPHMDFAASIPMVIQSLVYYSKAAAFDSTDPNLLRLRSQYKAPILKLPGFFKPVSDEMIIDRVSRLGLNADQEQAVLGLLRELRDIHREQGVYAPGGNGGQLEQTSVLV